MTTPLVSKRGLDLLVAMNLPQELIDKSSTGSGILALHPTTTNAALFISR